MSTRTRRARRATRFSGRFIANVSAASRRYMNADSDWREDAALRSAGVLAEVLDACGSRSALRDLDRRANAAFVVWIPDAAMDLVHFGRVRDGVTLLARLGVSLGYEPFSRELLERVAMGMRRWCSRGGEFEIDLPLADLKRAVELVRAECTTPAREDQLAAITGRPVPEWLKHASQILGEGGRRFREPRHEAR
jgi:hypothetical protein